LLKDFGDLNSDLTEWAREEAMATFTCPLLGMFLLGIFIDVDGLSSMK